MKDMLYAPVLEHVMVPKGTYDLIVEFSDSHSGHRTYIPDAKFVNYNESFATMERFIRDAVVAINQRGYSNNDISVATQKFIMESTNLWPTESIYHNRILKFMESAYRVPEKAKDLRNELVAEYPYLSDAITYMTRKYLEQYMTHIDQEMAFLESYISGDKYLPLQESVDYEFHGYYMPEGLGDQIASIPGKIIVLIKKLLNSLSASLSEAGKKFSNRILANNQVNEQAIQDMYKLYQANSRIKSQVPIRYPDATRINNLRQTYAAGFQTFEDQIKQAIENGNWNVVDKSIVTMIQSFHVEEGNTILMPNATYQDFRKAVLCIANNLILMDQFMVTLKNIDEAITAKFTDPKALDKVIFAENKSKGAANAIMAAKKAANKNNESFEDEDIQALLFTENNTQPKIASTTPVSKPASTGSSQAKPSIRVTAYRKTDAQESKTGEQQPQAAEQKPKKEKTPNQYAQRFKDDVCQKIFQEFLPGILDMIYKVLMVNSEKGLSTIIERFMPQKNVGDQYPNEEFENYNPIDYDPLNASVDPVPYGDYYSEAAAGAVKAFLPQVSDFLETMGFSMSTNSLFNSEAYNENLLSKIYNVLPDAVKQKISEIENSAIAQLLKICAKFAAKENLESDPNAGEGSDAQTDQQEQPSAEQPAATAPEAQPTSGSTEEAKPTNASFEYLPDDSIVTMMEGKFSDRIAGGVKTASEKTSPPTKPKDPQPKTGSTMGAVAIGTVAAGYIGWEALKARNLYRKIQKLDPNNPGEMTKSLVWITINAIGKLRLIGMVSNLIKYVVMENNTKDSGVKALMENEKFKKDLHRVFITIVVITAMTIVGHGIVPNAKAKVVVSARTKELPTPKRANQNLADTRAAVPDLARDLWAKAGKEVQTIWMFVNGWLYGGQEYVDPNTHKKVKTVGIAEIIRQEIECLSPYVNMNGVIQFSTEIE